MMYAIEKGRDRRRTVPVPRQAAITVAPQPAVPVRLPPEVKPLLNDLRTNLSDESRDGFLTLSADLRGVVIALNDETLFKPGEARIQTSAETSFDTIGRVLSRYPNHILLEGHTDSVPIHNARFRSNWELSTARSMAVMELLERNSDIASSRFSIAGSADNSPVAADSTEPGRALNRRVEIVVLEDPPVRQPSSAAPQTLIAPTANLEPPSK
jgi:chemotaxis protein MotB